MVAGGGGAARLNHDTTHKGRNHALVLLGPVLDCLGDVMRQDMLYGGGEAVAIALVGVVTSYNPYTVRMQHFKTWRINDRCVTAPATYLFNVVPLVRWSRQVAEIAHVHCAPNSVSCAVAVGG